MQHLKSRQLTPSSSSASTSTSTSAMLQNSNSSSALSFNVTNDHSHVHSSTSRKKRVGKACDSCRLKKTKCNGKQPCERCTLDNKICVYTERKKTKDKIYTGEHVELMEKRLDMVSKSLLKLCEMMKTEKREELAHFISNLEYNKGDEVSAVSINQAISLLIDSNDQSDSEDIESDHQCPSEEAHTTTNKENRIPPTGEKVNHHKGSNPPNTVASPESLSPKSLSNDLSPALLLDATSDSLSNNNNIPLDSINEEDSLSLANSNKNTDQHLHNDSNFSYDYTTAPNATLGNFSGYPVYETTPTLVSPIDELDEIAMMGFNSLDFTNFRSNSISLLNDSHPLPQRRGNFGAQPQTNESSVKQLNPMPQSMDEILVSTPDLQPTSTLYNSGYFSPSSITSDSSTMLFKNDNNNSTFNGNDTPLLLGAENSFADNLSTSPPHSLLKRTSSMSSSAGVGSIKKVPHTHSHSHSQSHPYSHPPLSSHISLKGLNMTALSNTNLSPLVIPGASNPVASPLQYNTEEFVQF